MRKILHIIAALLVLCLAVYFVLADMMASGSSESGFKDGLGRRIVDINDWEKRSGGYAEPVDSAVFIGGILLIVGCVKLAGKFPR